MTPEEQIEKLKQEVEHWRQAYRRVKTENEKLALDLGIRDYPQYCISTLGEQNAIREQAPPVQEGMEPTKGS